MNMVNYRQTCDELSERFAPVLWPLIMLLSCACFGLTVWLMVMLAELARL